jgi:DNA-binding IclR family transcriptional regulator
LWSSVEALDDYLGKVRHDGYATPEIIKTDLFLVSAPVFGEGHQLVGALGANLGEAGRFPVRQRQKIVKTLTDAAHDLSAPR